MVNMALLSHSTKAWLLGLASLLPLSLVAQNFAPSGSQYLLSGFLPGDQIHSSISISPSGGYVVWEDNASDGQGTAIGMLRLDSNFSPVNLSSRANQTAAGNQQRPQVLSLPGGGAVLAWQGGPQGLQSIFARILMANGTFSTTTDIKVNTYTNTTQFNPALTVLSNGNIVVTWSSQDQDGHQSGVFARVLTSSGQFVGAPFQINQVSLYDQHNPVVSGLGNGNFVVAWISDNQGLTPEQLSSGVRQSRVYGRLYTATGQPVGGEFRLDTASNLCSGISISGAAGGGFIAAWAQKDRNRTSSWDIYARSINLDGTPAGSTFRVNSTTYGDQYAPRISTMGHNQLVVWTSLGQDGSWEGVYGQLLADGVLNGQEFLINTTTLGKQVDPVVASDGTGRFLVAWSSYGATDFDLFAQRYSAGQPLPIPFAPWVTPMSESDLLVSWTPLLGYPLTGYEIYVDGEAAPSATISSNRWVISGLDPYSTHTVRLSYRMSNGQHSLLSAPGTGTTWGEDLNGDGLPDNWQARYWPGFKSSDWPGPGVDTDGDGVSNYGEFLVGTDPRDASSVLRVGLAVASGLRRMTWNTQAGSVYQVEVSSNLQTWSNFGISRLATGSSDSIVLEDSQSNSYYRVGRAHQ